MRITAPSKPHTIIHTTARVSTEYFFENLSITSALYVERQFIIPVRQISIKLLIMKPPVLRITRIFSKLCHLAYCS